MMVVVLFLAGSISQQAHIFVKHDIHVENHDFKMNLFVENVTYVTLRRAYMHTKQMKSGSERDQLKCAAQRDLDW